MTISLEASLKKLRTNYIDILYLHWVTTLVHTHPVRSLTLGRFQWDWETSIEEVMNGLHNLVASGKVLYLVGLNVPHP